MRYTQFIELVEDGAPPQELEPHLSDPDFDINSKFPRGDTPLFVAISVDSPLEVIDLLLACPRIKPDNVGRGELTCLALACYLGLTDIVRRLLNHPAVDPTFISPRGSAIFAAACAEHSGPLALLLADGRAHPGAHQSANGATTVVPLVVATTCNRVDSVKLLLADPRVDVTAAGDQGFDAFISGCGVGDTEVLEIFLEDGRANVNSTQFENATGLYLAAQAGRLDTLHTLMAYCGNLDTSTRIQSNTDPMENGKNAIEWVETILGEHHQANIPMEDYERAIKNGREVISLITQYDTDRRQTRANIQALPVFKTKFVPRIYALVVLFSDNYLHAEKAPPEVFRFLRIASSLPLELQMVLCRRVFGDARDVITSELAEGAFKWALSVTK